MGYFKQDDPFSFGSQLSILFPSTGFQKLLGSPATGDLTVVLGSGQLAQIRNAGQKGLVIDRKELNAQQSKSYSQIFKQAASAAQIPFLLGPLSLLPVVGAVITIVTSTVDGLSRISAASTSADQLSILMADGGSFSKVYCFSGAGGNRLGVAVVYGVSVGREARVYQVYSSVYAVQSGP